MHPCASVCRDTFCYLRFQRSLEILLKDNTEVSDDWHDAEHQQDYSISSALHLDALASKILEDKKVEQRENCWAAVDDVNQVEGAQRLN